jgi:basic membrane protein A and related proteins
MKNIVRMSAVAATAALALAACSAAPSATPSASSTAPAAPAYKACMVSDSGGFDDKSFNQSGYEGLLKAQTDLGISIEKAESNDAADYAPNIDAMIAAKCNLIITVGFNLADATQAAAIANPTQNFAIVDASFSDADFNPVVYPNVKSLLFATDQAAFLAGYAAAGHTKTGKVATFGGGNFPGVTDFMTGFLFGVNYHNTEKGTSVAVLGWDGKAGSVDSGFSDQTVGQTLGNGFIQQGADIILPVAGPVGLGTAQAAQAAGNVQIIGVDSDWTLTAPEYKDVVYGSILKEIGAAVYATITEATSAAGFSNASYIGTLENSGVGIAGITDDFTTLKAGIIAGTIPTK